MPRFANPANLATMLRLAVSPYIGELILSGQHVAALMLFLVAGFTDLLDGELARRFGWGTAAGAYLDPIADKVLLSTAYISLALGRHVPWWFVGVIFGRDVLILLGAGAALAFTSMRKFPPSVWCKISTFTQITAATAFMVRNAHPTPLLAASARALVWPATAATVWSGLHYAWRGIRAFVTRAPLTSPPGL